MIPAHYRWTANRDIWNIRIHCEAFSKKTRDVVLEDMKETVVFLQNHPKGGMKLTPHGKVRKAVTSKYRYVVTYIPTATRIDIIGIFRYQNRNV